MEASIHPSIYLSHRSVAPSVRHLHSIEPFLEARGGEGKGGGGIHNGGRRRVVKESRELFFFSSPSFHFPLHTTRELMERGGVEITRKEREEGRKKDLPFLPITEALFSGSSFRVTDPPQARLGGLTILLGRRLSFIKHNWDIFAQVTFVFNKLSPLRIFFFFGGMVTRSTFLHTIPWNSEHSLDWTSKAAATMMISPLPSGTIGIIILVEEEEEEWRGNRA